jgi:geranylgeranyl pyrophosphate synthase
MLTSHSENTKFHKISTDMKPELSAHYLLWVPYCKEALKLVYQDIFKLPLFQQHFEQKLILKHDKSLIWYEQFDSYIERGGKLLRPYLVCLCLEALGHDPKLHGLVIAASELIQTASLILDDIADDSTLRRGGQTVHTQTGLCAATEIGSSWLNIVFELINEYRNILGYKTADRLMNAIAWEHWVTGLGVTIDVTWPWVKRYDYNPNQYLQSVVHRTGSYSYRLPMKMAGILANLDDKLINKLEIIGESMGICFQLVDDLLNINPNEHWGKTLAEDITQGKITAQILFALQNANNHQRDRLINILNNKITASKDLAEAINIIEKTNGIEQSKAVIQQLVLETINSVDSLNFIKQKYKNLLHDFINYIVVRRN